MFDVGITELFFLGIIIVIVLGPDRLPEAIRYVSKVWVKFNHLKSDIQRKIDLELELTQLKEELRGEIHQVKQLESQMQHYFSNLEHDLIDVQKKYFPVATFQVKPPFKADFLLAHLMQWSCLDLKAMGYRYD